MNLPNIDEKINQILEDYSWTPEALTTAKIAHLIIIPGIGRVTARKIIAAAKEFMEQEEARRFEWAKEDVISEDVPPQPPPRPQREERPEGGAHLVHWLPPIPQTKSARVKRLKRLNR